MGFSRVNLEMIFKFYFRCQLVSYPTGLRNAFVCFYVVGLSVIQIFNILNLSVSVLLYFVANLTLQSKFVSFCPLFNVNYLTFYYAVNANWISVLNGYMRALIKVKSYPTVFYSLWKYILDHIVIKPSSWIDTYLNEQRQKSPYFLTQQFKACLLEVILYIN